MKEKDMTTAFRWYRASRIAGIIALLLIALSPHRLARTAAAAGPTVVTGSLGGAAYKIEMPAAWNGTP
jgi:CRISPR/Cas system endoribonuclease Cas6 (RAMP superfamily)